jgi:hypothetical protein
MLGTSWRRSFGWAFALVLLSGCSEDGKTKTQSASVASCDCAIDWAIDNTALCVAPHTSYSPPVIFSSYLDEAGTLVCDKTLRFPQPVPSAAWSAQTISSRCAGKGTLTLRIRPGKAKDASAADCILTEQSVAFDYSQANKQLALPDVAGWSAKDEACSRAFEQEGGYFEFRVESDQLGCGEADEKVNYVDICLATCQEDPTRAGCEACADRPDRNRL